MKDKAGMNKVLVFIRERTAIRQRPDIPSPEPPVSIAYVFGTVLVFLLGFQVVTGLALSAFYSPSSTDAWGSVAYIEDQVTGWVRWGSLVRGVHHHGAGAIVIIAGVHLVQTALSGAYKRPRELVWWLGVVLLLVVLAWAVTGYVLPWDQAGYWANQVEVGIAAGTPLLGEPIRDLALGGNDYGNLTLTRFYMLHVGLLPLVVTGLVIWHVVLARRHGRTPIGKWPMRQSRVHQRLRDAIACAILLTILLAFVIAQGGAGLSAPADPSQAYDARPLWYFRWLFALRELAGGSLEQFVAMAAPAIVVGFLVALPLLDKGSERGIEHRRLWLGILAGLLALIAALTVISFARDSGDHELAKRRAEADQLALRARALARTYGVPATGGADIWSMSPMWRGRVLFAKMCAGCHDAASDPKERVGPIIAPGHGDRAWLRAFLKSPSDPRFWGKTKLAKTDAAMSSADEMELTPAQVEDLVELLIAQSGETDVDRAKLVRSKEPFEKCMDCHTLNEGEAGSSGPNLFGLHSRAFYLSFISNPKLPVHMGDKSEMPRFDTDLSLYDRDALAEYLVWLRTATQADLDRLGPL
jgi:ubiquinol-cytochrome c reductase cytochrome b subunit